MLPAAAAVGIAINDYGGDVRLGFHFVVSQQQQQQSRDEEDEARRVFILRVNFI